MSELKLRKTCFKCERPVVWIPTRVEDAGPGFKYTCENCGNNGAKFEVLDERFTKDIIGLADDMTKKKRRTV